MKLKKRKKNKVRNARTSLKLYLSVFVFLILLSAVLMASLGIWGLSFAGVLEGVEGELEIGLVILFMLLISLIIGFALTFVSSRIPLKPVNELINKMHLLAAGDFKTRLQFGDTVSAHPVAAEITESFNTMAEELERTEMLRHDFINNFSHEFKTPIVSIVGLASLLEKGNLEEEQRLAYVRSIREESIRLSSMATNVLNLTKVENQTILTGVTRFNLSEQVRSAVLLLEGEWTKKEITLELDFEEYQIEANEEMLKQVWINLVDNAIKFSPQGGTVALEVLDEGDAFCVKIRNAGEIPAEKVGKIFGKFYQADESHATKGNGIGLAVVKSIAELHGGSVCVQSGEGMTEFSVLLPKEQEKTD